MAKKKPNKPARTDSVGIQFYADADTAKALEKYISSRADDERPSKRSVIVAAIRSYLQAKGFWPPDEK